MSAAATEATAEGRLRLPSAAREAMENLNAQAGGLHIGLRSGTWHDRGNDGATPVVRAAAAEVIE